MMYRIALHSIKVLLLLLASGWVVAHAQTPFQSDFDHFTTGWPLEGYHRNVDCERCHTGGIFQGTSRQCADCHSKGGLVRSTPPPVDHIRVTRECQDCHLETTWAPVWRVDHFQVVGTCSSCHNGSMASGKNPQHIPSSNNCEDCHSSFSWVPARFDHASVTETCVTCHNGGPAQGKNPQHIVSSNFCEDCHTTVAWLPALFDHSGVAPGTCNTCHLGDKSPGHMVTTQSCDACHSTTAWRPALFDHSNVVPGTCNNCHLGDKPALHLVTQEQCDACHSTTAWKPALFFDHANVPPGTCNNCHLADKPSQHPVTQQQCDVCHSPAGWWPLTFVHTSAGYPGDHAGNLSCADCHGNSLPSVEWTMPAYRPDCAACHDRDFKPGPHKRSENPDAFYNASELRDCSGACHIYQDSSLTTIKTFRPGPEHRVRDRGFN